MQIQSSHTIKILENMTRLPVRYAHSEIHRQGRYNSARGRPTLLVRFTAHHNNVSHPGDVVNSVNTFKYPPISPTQRDFAQIRGVARSLKILLSQEESEGGSI